MGLPEGAGIGAEEGAADGAVPGNDDGAATGAIGGVAEIPPPLDPPPPHAASAIPSTKMAPVTFAVCIWEKNSLKRLLTGRF